MTSAVTRYELSRRYADGTRICVQPADGTASADGNLLFLVRADGRLAPVTRSGPPEPEPGDSMVVLMARSAGSSPAGDALTPAPAPLFDLAVRCACPSVLLPKGF